MSPRALAGSTSTSRRYLFCSRSLPQTDAPNANSKPTPDAEKRPGGRRVILLSDLNCAHHQPVPQAELFSLFYYFGEGGDRINAPRLFSGTQPKKCIACRGVPCTTRRRPQGRTQYELRSIEYTTHEVQSSEILVKAHAAKS